MRGAVRGEERAGDLCLGRADAGLALGVAAREELVVRCGTIRAHGVGGDEHRVVRGCGHWVREGAGEACVGWACVLEDQVVGFWMYLKGRFPFASNRHLKFAFVR